MDNNAFLKLINASDDDVKAPNFCNSAVVNKLDWTFVPLKQQQYQRCRH